MKSEIVTDSDGRQFIEFEDGKRNQCTGYVGQVKSAYMCATDFQHEVGEAPKTGPLCDSVESLRDAKACVDECGWVRVLVIAMEYGGRKQS